jgi:hypothetical protein
VETATLVIAVVGVTLGALSLIWQATTWLLTGPRVKVSLREGFRGPGGAILGPRALYTDAGLAALRRQGFTDPILAIEAVNVGRLPTTVRSWSIVFGNRAAYENQADPRNPQLPYRLEPHSSASWYAPLEDLQALQPGFTDQSDEAATVRGVIDLQSRQTITSKEALIVNPAGTRVQAHGWRIVWPWRGWRRGPGGEPNA